MKRDWAKILRRADVEIPRAALPGEIAVHEAQEPLFGVDLDTSGTLSHIRYIQHKARRHKSTRTLFDAPPVAHLYNRQSTHEV
ncbi:unnamed protein product [marine sediment metagenome]|uniref:Uncharacterized protein n=1 Tax=marine sediment metagenome TaxID=412755 RepID=X0V520_9ZZZZ